MDDDGYEECGCCELGEYEPPSDNGIDVACVNCNHSPEEHGL